MTFGRFIAALLLLNLVAVAGFIVVVTNAPEAGPSRPAASRSVVVVTNVVTVTNHVAPATTAPFHWRNLESEDYPTYIANLRAIGCPEQTIRDIIIADLDLLWAPRLQAMLPQRRQPHYWESVEQELRNDYDPRSWERLQRAIQHEKRDVIRELVNVDLAGERARLRGEEDPLETRLAFLPSETRMDLRAVLDHYEESEGGILESMDAEGVALEESDRARLRALREQRDAELDRLLSPEQRRQYDLWMSDTGEALRHDMYGMKASEEEFLTLFDLRRELDRLWDPELMDLSDPDLAARQEEARLKTEEAIQEALGPQRYKEYQRGQDEDYHLLNRAASRYGLDAGVADQLYQYKQVLAAEREGVIMNSELSPGQIEEVLRAMNEEAQRAARQALGPDAYNYFRRHSDWLRP